MNKGRCIISRLCSYKVVELVMEQYYSLSYLRKTEVQCTLENQLSAQLIQTSGTKFHSSCTTLSQQRISLELVQNIDQRVSEHMVWYVVNALLPQTKEKPLN